MSHKMITSPSIKRNWINFLSFIIFVVSFILFNSQAIAGDGLQGEYWNYSVVDNAYNFPNDDPDLIRVDSTIDFNWGSDSPDNDEIDDNRFAVRWSGQITAPESGNFVFHTQSDDGVRLWINGQLLINNWTRHGPTWDNSSTINLIAGQNYDIKMEFFEHGRGAVARLYWQTPSNQTPHVIPTSDLSSTIKPTVFSVFPEDICSPSNDTLLVTFNVDMKDGNNSSSAERKQNYTISPNNTPPGLSIVDAELLDDQENTVRLTFNKPLTTGVNYTLTVNNVESDDDEPISPDPFSIAIQSSGLGIGLQGQYWNHDVWDNGRVFPTSNPDIERIDPTIDFNWGSASPDNTIDDDQFAARWQGSITAPTDGDYVFSTNSDDGVRLWVNGDLVIDNWTAHSATWDNSDTITLTAGERYNIKMEFFDRTGDAVARLAWQTPSNNSRSIIPSTVLSPCTIPTVLPAPYAEYRFDACSLVDQVKESQDRFHGIATDADISEIESILGGRSLDLSDTGTADWITLPKEMLNNIDDFSFSVWFKTAVSSRQQEIFQALGSGTSDDELEVYIKNDDEISFKVRDDSTTLKANQTLTDNVWHHILITRQGRDACLYVDGRQEDCDSRSVGSGALSVSHDNSIVIGQEQDRLRNAPDIDSGFNASQSFKGFLDELKIYNSVLNSAHIATLYANESSGKNADGSIRAIVPCSGEIDHFELYYPDQALTCTPADITIKACSNADCSILYTENVSVDLSPITGWSANPVNMSTGEQLLTLQHTTPGIVVLDIINSSIIPTTPLQCFSNNTIVPQCSITFSETGFIFDVPALTACKPTADITIRSVKMSDHNVSCVGALTGTHSVDFWSTYLQPNSGSNKVIVNGRAINNASSGTAVNLNFDVNSEAKITVQYDDAGQLDLNANYTNTTTGLTLVGNDIFVSKPVMLAVYSDEANASCASIDASCSKFKKAGENFNLKVNAACWTHDGDSDFSDNPVTANFTLNSIATNHSLLSPAGGNNGSHSVNSFNFSTNDNGTHTLSQSVSEVGVFSFGVSPPNYFGESLAVMSSPAIGRFYPDHFEVSTVTDGAFGANACTGFSYSGQTFTYQTKPQLKVTAYNAASPAEITQNYTGDFAKLVATDFNLIAPTTDSSQLGADNINLVRLNWVPDAASLNDNADGSLTLSLGDDSYTYRHEANSKIAEFNNAVDLSFTEITDSDDVQTISLPHALQPSGEAIRFGRLTISNAHGSELAPLPVSITAEYFNGVNWTENTADQCTVLDLSTQIQLANSETAGGSWQSGNSTMIINEGSTSGTLSNNNPLQNGLAVLTMSAPGEDNQGYVDIQSRLSTSYDWLLGDFDNDGQYDDNASGRASFGLFKGGDNIIFRREVY